LPISTLVPLCIKYPEITLRKRNEENKKRLLKTILSKTSVRYDLVLNKKVTNVSADAARFKAMNHPNENNPSNEK